VTGTEGLCELFEEERVEVTTYEDPRRTYLVMCADCGKKIRTEYESRDE
jgi:hypothetical protein